MKRSQKLAIAGIGAAAVIAAKTAATYAVTKDLVKIAMDRQPPKKITKMRGKIRGSSMEQDFLTFTALAAEKLERSNHDTIQIEAQDGTLLTGHWRKVEQPKRIIIAMHGWRSSWSKDFGMISDFLESQGCCVLYAEERAQGESEGEHIGFGLLERADCIQWILWANAQMKQKLPIYLYGISMGATAVLLTADCDLPGNVCGIIADSGFTSPRAIWKYIATNNLHLKGLYDERLADKLCRDKIQYASGSFNTVDVMKRSRVPILFIHGNADTFVPLSMTYNNYYSKEKDGHLLIIEGAKHGQCYYKDRRCYEDAFLDFWRSYDTFCEETKT